MEIKLKGVENATKTNSKGKEYNSCKLTVWSDNENRDIWISGWQSPNTLTWQTGDVVDVDVEKTETGYWNFKENKNTKPSPTTLDVLKNILAVLESMSSLVPNTSKNTLKTSNMTPSALGEPVESQQVKTNDPEFDSIVNGM